MVFKRIIIELNEYNHCMNSTNQFYESIAEKEQKLEDIERRRIGKLVENDRRESRKKSIIKILDNDL
jgi:hypothetical protein